jgi:outer membrane protein assembly factor BamD
MKYANWLTGWVLLLVAAFALVGCSENVIKKNLTAEERFEVALKMFNKGDYFRARTQFKIITLNHPGSSVVDKAQFYLAESHFKMKEYLLAAEEYKKLLRLYPRSDLVDDAQFKVALCYFKLSPKPSLDQDYTFKAIQELQRFLEDFPESELVPEAGEKLKQLRDKLAKKEYDNATIYRKMAYYESALIYYDSVLNNYYDTKYADEALYWKGVMHKELRQYNKARTAFEMYLKKYPKSRFVPRVREYLREIGELEAAKRSADGQASNAGPPYERER